MSEVVREKLHKKYLKKYLDFNLENVHRIISGNKLNIRDTIES